jgi:hypothetical protein
VAIAFKRAATLVVACAVFFTLPGGIALAGSTAPASDGAGSTREEKAFEAAKELGTADAWNAFLANYPTGFHADLARAYLKKVGEQSEAPAVAPSSARAAERSCSDRKSLRSEHSREPTKITFVNKSGMYRAIMWINFEGKLQDYGGVNSGDQVTLDTYRTHPWMIATGPGDCLQIFMPAAEPATVELVRLEPDDPPKKAAPETKQTQPEKKTEVKKKPLVCAKNYKLQNGKCVLIQNCGKNAYRSPEGDCYCNKGYQMQGGKCTWPHDKQGFEVAPWKKSGCKTLQAQCSQGNGKACVKFEETCQVN